MSSLFDFDQQPDHYAVIGNPIAHSKSPVIHRLFAKQTKQNINYQAIQVDLGGLEQAVGNFFANGGCGLNITVPFKRDAWNIANVYSKRAQLAGAVNTLQMNTDGEICADNTDGIGLVNDLSNNHKIAIENKRILLLGAGGAARGVIQPLLQYKPTQLVVVNRTAIKAVELAADFTAFGPIKGCGYDDPGFYDPGFNDDGFAGEGDNTIGKQEYDIIINATSASLHGDLPPIPISVVGPHSMCYDMMYGAQDTAFIAWSKNKSLLSVDGLGMLVEQAAESFFIWRGVRPDTQSVIAAIRHELKSTD